MQKKYAIIVAGGVGNRAGGFIPKQFQELEGVPVLWWSVRAFRKEDPETRVILVLHPDYQGVWEEIHSRLPEEERGIEIEIAHGGKSRAESVRNGLAQIPGNGEEGTALVAVHDAARPMLSPELIRRGWESAAENGAAIPVCDMIDSMRELDGSGESRAVDRSRYVRVQTPQVFELGLLKRGYRQELTSAMTDDASVVEAMGQRIALFEGDEANIKVTNPIDFAIARVLIGKRGEA